MLLTLTAMVGCNVKDDPAAGTNTPGSPGSSGSTGNQGNSPGDNTGAAPDPGPSQYGGILTIGTGATVATPGYTPLCTTNASQIYTRVAYESLASFDEQGRLIPMLATSWTTNPDEPSVTWTLQQGVQFADGEPFNAQAVVANIEAYRAANRPEVMGVVSMDIISDYEIKMNLAYWNSSAVDSIGYFVLYMSPVALQDEEALYATTCGTGPFQMTDFVTNISATYTRNDNYWQEGKPYLDGVRINVIPEITTLESAFIAEECDIILAVSMEVGNDLRERYPDRFASGDYLQVVNGSGQGVVSTGLIPASYDPSSPWADVRVRLAMAYAIDTDTLIEAFTYGAGIKTNQWAIPGSITYNDAFTGVEYNPDRARALLAEAGYANGFDTTINSPPGDAEIVTAIAPMLTEVGIRTTVNMVDGATFFGYMASTWEGLTIHAATVAPDLGLYMGRHLGDDATFYKNGIVRPPEAVALLEQIRMARTDQEKIRLSMQMQELIYNGEDGLMIFGRVLCVKPQQVIKHSWLHNDTITTCFDGTHVTLADAWISR